MTWWWCWTEGRWAERPDEVARSRGGGVLCPVCRDLLVLLRCRPVDWWVSLMGSRRVYGPDGRLVWVKA